MDNPKKKYYLTTPIYYANSRPHVGSAYTTIVCDVIARYKRMCGYDVAYLTGTDEHGVNIERAAEKLGISPADLVDRNQQIFRDLWKLLGISYTDFVRTTEPRHAVAVQNLVRRTQRVSPDAIFKRKYEGRYCIYDNLYVSDTPEPADCQICGRPAELISEENYFFRLSAYQEKLLQLYKDQPDFVQPDFRLNEVKSFVESGLKDLSISRKTIKWGIPWPGDPEHVFYVWYDALTSYMSGIGFVDGEPNSKKDSERFKKFWPADVHMIGKEIIRFHAVYWPAFLMAAFPDKKLSDTARKNPRARLAALRARKNEQVQRQRSLCRADRESPGQRRPALLPAARNRLRPGRQFQQRRPDHPLQRRSWQRPRESRQPHAHDDRKLLRRHCP